jgi:beta-ketoacyl-acyl-carrier-protein synthase II
MNRVVITGIGAISSLGKDAEENWQSCINGQTGVGPITLFDASDLPFKVAAEIKDFNPSDYFDRREVRRWDRFEHLANIAANEAIAHSGLEINEENSTRVGTVVSSGVGGLETLVEQIGILHDEGPRRLSPFTIPRIMTNGASGTISINHGIRGPAYCVTSACASAADGIGTAMQLLRSGLVDAVVSGGAEAGVSTFGIGSFDRIGAYTSKTDNTPSPFSKDRDGLVMGEGAAVLILETLDHAQKRGADILAELVGYGASADAYHITAPTEDGSGSAIAVRKALADAQIDADSLDYINAHGTGTPLNDEAETRALKAALGEEAYNIPTSSTKSMTGHMMGATGALEAMFCALAIRDGVAPPTINYHEPDPECDLDYVPNEAREFPIRIAMSNSFGFGGHNAVLVLKAFED